MIQNYRKHLVLVTGVLTMGIVIAGRFEHQQRQRATAMARSLLTTIDALRSGPIGQAQRDEILRIRDQLIGLSNKIEKQLWADMMVVVRETHPNLLRRRLVHAA